MKKKIFFLGSICCIFFGACNGQKKVEHWVNKFDVNFDTNYSNNKFASYSKYKKLATSKDAIHFMPLSYGVNALTTMYKTTGDIKYLEANKVLIKNVIAASIEVPLFQKEIPENSDNKLALKTIKYKAWKVRSRVPDKIKGQDWQLYDGYLFRYVAQYLYVLKKNEILKKHPEFQTIYQMGLSFLETHVWDKWQKRSEIKYGNFSSLYMIRTHMGSHFATIALYLKELTDDPARIYTCEKVIETYNTLLKNNFKIKKEAGRTYYIWHSTYDVYPKNQAIMRVVKRNETEIWQDVTHGNQVVNYILAAYRLDDPNWKNEDVEMLINTVKYVTWDELKKSFIDRLVPSEGKNDPLKNTGWKQSDGWLKLASYDRELLDIYEDFYEDNKKRIDSSSLAAQFYAQMAYNYKYSEEE